MQQRLPILFVFFLFISTIFFVEPVDAQALLQQRISLDIQKVSLGAALNTISKKGDFYFSYNSNLLPPDSIVSLKANQLKLSEILRQLLGAGFVFRENGKYIIIQKFVAHGSSLILSGYVVNELTGEKIPNASVYVPRQFATTLTNKDGYFRLRIKNRFPEIQLGVRKLYYQDILLKYAPGSHQNLTIPLLPIQKVKLPLVEITSSWINDNWLSRLFLSSKQAARDINFSQFFIKQPFQYSIWPDLGTHGKMSAQVVNKFSLNILGGYSLGANGFEFGSLFNIDKEDVRYFQTAGLFNLVGGKMAGFQLAGLYNRVKDSVAGVQIAGLINRTSDVQGFQLAGLINTNQDRAKGLQIAGLVNKTKLLNSLQFGLINISDTATGYSLGLVNIVKKNPYYKLALSANEFGGLKLAFKSGNEKLFNIFSIGMLPDENIFSIGYGLGRETRFGKRWHLMTELIEEIFIYGYQGDDPIMARLQPLMYFSLNKKMALFAGPAFSLYFTGTSIPKSGGQDPILPAHYYDFSSKLKGWWGFQVGVSLF